MYDFNEVLQLHFFFAPLIWKKSWTFRSSGPRHLLQEGLDFSPLYWMLCNLSSKSSSLIIPLSLSKAPWHSLKYDAKNENFRNIWNSYGGSDTLDYEKDHCVFSTLLPSYWLLSGTVCSLKKRSKQLLILLMLCFIHWLDLDVLGILL